MEREASKWKGEEKAGVAKKKREIIERERKRGREGKSGETGEKG